MGKSPDIRQTKRPSKTGRRSISNKRVTMEDVFNTEQRILDNLGRGNVIRTIMQTSILVILSILLILTYIKMYNLENQSIKHMKEMVSLMDFYSVEKFLIQKNPQLKKRTVEIQEMLRLAYQYCRFYGLDPYTFVAQGCLESIYFKKTCDKTFGQAGEVGWWQILPPTGLHHGYTPKDLKDMEKNINCAAIHFTYCMQFANNDEHKALATYNGGKSWWKSAPQKYADVVFEIRDEIKRFVEFDIHGGTNEN